VEKSLEVMSETNHGMSSGLIRVVPQSVLEFDLLEDYLRGV
jgi:hypothetical protein